MYLSRSWQTPEAATFRLMQKLRSFPKGQRASGSGGSGTERSGARLPKS